MKLPVVFERYRGCIDAQLRAALAGCQSPMYDMLRYHLGWLDEEGNPLLGAAGKALRPTLCLLACEAAGGAYEQALPAAAALELVHNFSLIHDDIQDGDRERRHRPTVWSIWGRPQAINAGTAMRVLASLALLGLADCDTPARKVLGAAHILDESCLRLIEGQYLDISYEDRLDVGVGDYLRMIELKTASLIACSLELGALLGTDDQRAIRALRRFGLNVGLAFQIRDDVLGIWGDEERTGKPVGSDIRRRKKSLPVVYALERVEGRTRTELVSTYNRQAIDDGLDTVLNILAAMQAKARAESMAEEYCAKAIAELRCSTSRPRRARGSPRWPAS